MLRLLALLAFLIAGCITSEAQTRVHIPFGSASVSYIDIETGRSHRVDTATHATGDPFFEPSWSPDSR
jgi:hypothetical protein